MWCQTFEKIYPGVSINKAWDIVTDINNWPTWHDDLAYCRLEASFQVGSTFLLKPKKGPEVKIALISIQERKSFIDCTSFWGAKMYDEHAFEETPDGLCIKNKVWVTGPLSWLWIWLVAKNVAASSEEESDKLAALARERP